MHAMLTPFILLLPALQRFGMGLVTPCHLLPLLHTHPAGHGCLPTSPAAPARLLYCCLSGTRAFPAAPLRRCEHPLGRKAVWEAQCAAGLPLMLSSLRGEPRLYCMCSSFERDIEWNISFCFYMQISQDSSESSKYKETYSHDREYYPVRRSKLSNLPNDIQK